MVRLVLLRDASEEYPKNTSSIFTVRLPEALQLGDGEWEVCLLSLAMPDAGLRLDELTAASADRLVEALLDGSTGHYEHVYTPWEV